LSSPLAHSIFSLLLRWLAMILRALIMALAQLPSTARLV
jgi:hypothetical protein